jgi:hypothetical protein
MATPHPLFRIAAILALVIAGIIYTADGQTGGQTKVHRHSSIAPGCESAGIFVQKHCSGGSNAAKGARFERSSLF